MLLRYKSSNHQTLAHYFENEIFLLFSTNNYSMWKIYARRGMKMMASALMNK